MLVARLFSTSVLALSVSLVACGSGSATSEGTGASGTGGSGTSSSGTTATGTGGSDTSSSTGTTGTGGVPSTACSVFPTDNWWNTDISKADVDPLSDAYIKSMGESVALHPDFGTEYGIPYQYVDSSVTKSPVTFDYDDESDPGPYPIPNDPLIEDGGDRHILMIHSQECVLYELFAADHEADGWYAGSGAIWDLKKNSTRPAGWTSADAAGLPIFPGLARYEEASKGAINHALRFTASNTQAAYVAPASHHASDDTNPNLPPMGLRLRLKASVDISGASPQAKVVLAALKKYGMILADNGSNLYVSGAPDLQWDDDDLHWMQSHIHGSDFEAVKTGPLVTD
ncbi:hypothetical protein A7982_12992 [Minicystis rosea]|nr:hypothetical protein A7982_12992 [Minicystis rosea]